MRPLDRGRELLRLDDDATVTKARCVVTRTSHDDVARSPFAGPGPRLGRCAVTATMLRAGPAASIVVVVPQVPKLVGVDAPTAASALDESGCDSRSPLLAQGLVNVAEPRAFVERRCPWSVAATPQAPRVRPGSGRAARAHGLELAGVDRSPEPSRDTADTSSDVPGARRPCCWLRSTTAERSDCNSNIKLGQLRIARYALRRAGSLAALLSPNAWHSIARDAGCAINRRGDPEHGLRRRLQRRR
jgi:hypothetical protein